MPTYNRYFEAQANLLIQKAEKLSQRANRQYIYRAAVLTVYGFQVAIPVLMGILIGFFLDKRFTSEHISWTLNLIILGFVLGFYNANRWFYQMIEIKHHNKTKRRKDRK